MVNGECQLLRDLIALPNNTRAWRNLGFLRSKLRTSNNASVPSVTSNVKYFTDCCKARPACDYRAATEGILFRLLSAIDLNGLSDSCCFP